MTPSTFARRCRPYALSLFLAAGVAGCGSKVDQSDYDKVNNGMTQAQVEGILGTDKEQSTNAAATPGVSVGGMSVPGMSAKTVTWKDGDKTIIVVFTNDKVASKTSSGL